MRVAGLISGTSADGIDAAVIDIDNHGTSMVTSGCVPYPEEVRDAILAVSNGQAHTGQIARLNFLLGELFAEALIAICHVSHTPMHSIDLVGSHGQTIFHQGEPVEFCGRKIASTQQIGEASVIARRTGAPVISDFRVADMAAGGKGAPLVPFLDYRLFRSDTLNRIALNIGGIANLTVIPAGAQLEDVVAFDTGPGNMVMDQLAPPFDRDGLRARAGTVNPELLARLLEDPYYAAPPPKTAGREQYGPEFVASTGIDLATAAELTAETIARAIAAYRADEVIVSGGGAHNGYLMERLRALLPGPRLTTSAEFGMDVDAKEAVLFAVLAYETWNGRPSNLPSATGAHKAAVLGKLSH
jgi:anhydro-N-acetylmuramic acid kinase